MSTGPGNGSCSGAEQRVEYALGVLSDEAAASMREHVSGCADCAREVEGLRSTVAAFVDWPTDVLRPPTSLWSRLTERIAGDERTASAPVPRSAWREPEWEEVAPGISCKLLATDSERQRVSMLVKLAPGVAYPPHRHAGVEELHLLEGELMIGERKLLRGDYNHALPGTDDHFVWSATGCTCVLIASPKDEIR